MSPSDIVDQVPTPATLWELPNELLLLIIQSLDNASILNLGLTCQLMNSIALNYFFLINNIGNPATGRFSSLQDRQPIEALPVLRSALFVKRLSYFDFVLNPGIEMMRSEVSDIRVLAARLQAMKAFSIRFPRGNRIVPHSRYMQKCLPMDPWYKAVTSLLVAVLEKGCTVLHVAGGTDFSRIYQGDMSPRKLIKAEVNVNQQLSKNAAKESCIVRPRKLSFNLLRRLRRKKGSNVPPGTVETGEGSSGPQTTNMVADAENLPAAEPALPSRSKMQLAEVDIQSDMLLQHPFSQWTLLTLNAASSTITKLSLKFTSEASSTWKIFSATLSLPLLRTFSFTNELFIPLDVPLFTDVEDFLINHPRIKNLSLYGVGFPRSSDVPRANFQCLYTIDAHPFYIIWLMNNLSSNPNFLPSLQGVTIPSDNHTYSTGQPDFDDALFDSALGAISSFPRNISLTLIFNSKFHFEYWIGSHVQAGVERSVISGLVHVTRLSIDNKSCLEFTDATIAIIPDWLQLFPALKYLKFEWEVARNKARLTEPQYLATISMLCQKLETMEVNWRMFDLELVRKNLGVCSCDRTD